MDDRDLLTGISLRDTGMRRAVTRTERQIKSEWMAGAYSLLDRFMTGRSGVLCEDFKLWAIEQGYPAPSSAGTWGAFWKAASQRGLITFDGGMRQSQMPKSHARRMPTWTKGQGSVSPN